MNELPIKKVVFSEEAIQERIEALGKAISRDYKGNDLVLIGVLTGSFYFMADLSRALDIPVQMDFMAIGVYPNSQTKSGAVRIVKDLNIDIAGRHVLLVESIIRTGLTTGYLAQTLSARMPASVNVCSLLVCPEQQLIDVPMPYFGFEVSPDYLIGYGLDHKENWRNLKYISEMES